MLHITVLSNTKIDNILKFTDGRLDFRAKYATY